MERITYRLTLDAHKNGVQKMLQGFQTADNISRRMVICIASGGNTINVDSTDTVAMMYVTTPNATEPSINACTIENNTVIYDVLPIVEAGITEMQIKLIETTSSGAEKVLATPKFAIEVSQSGMDDSGAEQTTTFTALEQAIAQANGVYNERLIRVDFTEDCVFQAYYADGTIYENDSFKVVLSDCVANAKESEYNAHVAETSAIDSAINAKASESNAKVSEKNAKVSEANAKRYMENALNATPEGYGLLDIQETTNTTLENSKAGGLKLVSMRGKTVQKYSKNLLNVPSTFTGTKLEVEVYLKAGVTYTLSCSALSESVNGTLYDASGITVGWVNLVKMPPIIGGTAVAPEEAEDTFTPKSDVVKIEFDSPKEEFTIYNLQLEEGTEATEYERYMQRPSMGVPVTINRVDAVFLKSHGNNFIEESVALITLNSPLAEDDYIETRGGKMYEHHKQGELVIDGNSNVTLYGSNEYGITHFELIDQSIKNDSTNCYCTHFKKSLEGSNTKQEGFFISEKAVYFRVKTSRCATAEAFKAWLAENPMTLVYNLQEETDTVMSDDVQRAINGLETFDDVTHIVVEGDVKPEIVYQYGTSRVGAITLKNELRLNDLEL